ncbi:MAG: DUF937 domain-containing protein, partial [Verrucomicrobiota bacterium]
MSINLLESIKGQLGDQIVGQISGLLGENKEKAKAGIASVLPALLGGVMRQASTPEGANALSAALDDKKNDDLLENFGTTLGSGNVQSVVNEGGGILNGLMGSKLSGVVDAVSGSSGLSRNSTGSLMGLLAPVVMGFLGKQKRTMGLDARGLSNLMAGQKDHLAAAMPEGLGDSLGLASLLGGAAGIGGAVAGAAGAVTGLAGGAVAGAQGAASGVAGAAGNLAGGLKDAAGNVAGGAAD